MRKLGRQLFWLALGLLLTLNASATVYYVNVANPSPAAPYTDWSTAATNIQDAVDVASAGDVVLVTDGVYQYGGRVVYGAMTNRVAVTQPLTLQSVNGPGLTTILGYQVPGTTNGDAAVRCVFLTNGAVLSGFTLTNGATRNAGDNSQEKSGGGVWCAATNSVVSNCVMVGNSAAYDGGGANQGAFYNCSLSGNTAFFMGGGAYNGILNDCQLIGNSAANQGGGAASGTLSNCSLAFNLAGNYGGGIAGGTLNQCTLSSNSAALNAGGGAYLGWLSNCVFVGNSAPGGGGAYAARLINCALSGNSASISGGGADNSHLYNCTVTGNTALTNGGVFASTLLNCIVYFNNAQQTPNYDLSSTLYYCCAAPLPTSGPGNIASDPQLASTSHLSVKSPCRGAGNSSYAAGADIDGDPWLNPPSIGCDEYISGSVTGALSVALTSSYTNVGVGYVVNFQAIIGGRTSGSRWDFGDGTVVTNQPYASHAFAASGDYPVVLTAFNESYPAGVTSTVVVHVIQEVHYVALGGSAPTAPYGSWDTAATNIQDAIDVASIPGALVLVSNGVYQTGGRVVYGAMTNRVAVGKPLILQSLNGPQVTAIVGYRPALSDIAVRCVYLTNDAVLSGFTLTNGGTRVAGDPVHEQSGGGIWSESSRAMVSNCVLILNGANYGGGAYLGTLMNCTVRSNWAAYYGGGTMNATLSSCTVDDNIAYAYAGAGGAGGGVYGSTLSNCKLSRNTIVVQSGNTPSGGAGAGAFNSILYNCTLSSNWISGPAFSASGIGAYQSVLQNCVIYYNASQNVDRSTLNYCCTTPLPFGGIGNFTNAPVFVNVTNNDLHLQSNSPCINAGLNAFAPGPFDLDGNPRISGGTVDVGAYEFQNPASTISYAWLQQYGLPTDGSADFADTDHDGMNNWQEWRAGTNPTNAASVLKLLSPSPSLTNSNVTVTWASVNNRNYYIQRAISLASGAPTPFSVVATNLPGLSSTTSWTDTNAPAPGPAFYRVGVQ